MFRARYPEFNNVSDVLCTAVLSEAALEHDTSVWGAFGQVGGPATKADAGQMALAAHKLAVSPYGQNARTVYDKKPGFSVSDGYKRTTYGWEWLNMRYAVTSGWRVA